MKPRNYILDKNKNAVPCDNFLDWAIKFEHEERIVRQNVYLQFTDSQVTHCFLSTVFLGLDMNHSDTGKPILWETMLFEDGDSILSKRYSSHLEALEWHNSILKSQKHKLLITLLKAIPVSLIFIGAVITLSQI